MIDLKVIYFGKHGIVTDLGDEVQIRCWGPTPSHASSVELMIPRYGVWELNNAEGNYRVTHTMRSLDMAKIYADTSDEDWERKRNDCTSKPAEFEDVAKLLHAIHPEAQVVNTGGGIDCIRVLVGHHALYFGTGGENWGASVYTILSDGNEQWLEDGSYDPNINLELSSDEPDAAKVATAINAATDAFYSKHYITHNRDIPHFLTKEYESQKKKSEK